MTRPLALVTGAGRRIGRSIALHLAAQGYDLALHCHRSRAEAEEVRLLALGMGVAAEVHAADLADEGQVRALMASVVARQGVPFAVVNNASLFEYDSVADFSYEALSRHLLANTAAPVMLARLLAEQWPAEAGRSACVVNLLDQKLWNPNPDYLSYTLSKAALEAANTLLAQALAPKVRVLGVAPGVTLVSGPMNDTEFQSAHQMTPLGRSSSPEDIARAVRFLIESPAMTGTTLLVDGGQHLAAQGRDVLFLAQAQLAPKD